MGRGIGPTAQNMAKGSLLSIPFSAISARFHFSFSPAPELPTYGQSSTKEASAEERGADYDLIWDKGW